MKNKLNDISPQSSIMNNSACDCMYVSLKLKCKREQNVIVHL